MRATALIDRHDVYHLLVIAVIELSRLSGSRRVKRFLVCGIAHAAYALSRRRRRLMEHHLERAVGELTRDERRWIIRRSFRETWEEIFSYAPSRAEDAALENADLRGAEHLRAALARGRGAILWTTALGRRLAAKRVLHHKGILLQQLQGARHVGAFSIADTRTTWVRRSIVKPFLDNRERRCVGSIIHVSDGGSLAFGRHMQRHLERNAILCLTGDTPNGRRLVPVRIGGLVDHFPTGAMSLALWSGAAVLPMFCTASDDDRLQVTIEPPIAVRTDLPRERAVAAGIEDLARVLESYVRRHPGLYRNWHLFGASDVRRAVPADRSLAAASVR